MKIEQKHNYLDEHKGYFWAEECNQINNEITNTYTWYTQPLSTKTTQMVEGINNMTFQTYWNGIQNGDNNIILRRVSNLPIPDMLEGSMGVFKMVYSNRRKKPLMGFTSEILYPCKYRNSNIEFNDISADELYVYIVEKDDARELYFNIFPMSLTNGETRTVSSGRMVTSKPTIIVDNQFLLDEVPYGDLAFNECRCYVDDGTGKAGNTYDTVKAVISEDDGRLVLVANDDIDINGRYGVVSYTV